MSAEIIRLTGDGEEGVRGTEVGGEVDYERGWVGAVCTLLV